MIGQTKPYPAYKASGVTWLGRLPEHWQIRSLGSLTKARSKRGRPDLPLLSVVREKGVILRSSMTDEENHNFIPDDLSNYKVAPKGSLVINKMKAWQGSLGLAPCEGIVSPAYFVYDFTIEDSRFGQALLRSKTYVAMFAQASDGVRIGQWDLSIDGMKRIPVIVPPPMEQAAIVRFLHQVDSRIRRYIRTKQRLIKLLQEEKHIIIYRAVTRGLDPRTPVTPSGADWLGDVPAHWEVTRVKQISTILRGKFSHRPRNAPELYDGPYPFLQTGDVARASKLITSFSQSLNDKGLAVSKMFPKGTLAMTIAANIGDVAILDFDACFPDSVVGFVPNRAVRRDFLYYTFRSMKADLLLEAPVNTQGNLNIGRIGSRVIPKPPLDEQDEIVQAIESDTRAIEAATAKAQQEIQLALEYRTRLISDVVTGKLDVREAASNLPDDIEQPDEPLAAETLDISPEDELAFDELAQEEVVA